MNELQVRLCPVEQLVPYQKNARTHSEEQIAQIAASIQEFGWTNPILVGPDNVGRCASGNVVVVADGEAHHSGFTQQQTKSAYFPIGGSRP
jgi:ParB-like chromosome segregation protein Spo0J